VRSKVAELGDDVREERKTQNIGTESKDQKE